MSVIFICIFLCTSSFGQKKNGFRAVVSADISQFVINRKACLSFSHSFSGKWSAEGGASLQIYMPAGKNAEKDEHNMNLSDEKEKTDEYMSPEFRAGVIHWPGGFLKGFYISACCTHRLPAVPDIALGCGYSAHIWKRLGLSVGYEMNLIESTQNSFWNTEGITIRLNIAF